MTVALRVSPDADNSESPSPCQRLAARINAAHEACVHAERDALRYAIQAGALLTEVKGRVGHGGYIEWVRANCAFTIRTAQLYCQVASAIDDGRLNAKLVSHLGFREALELLRKETPGDRLGARARNLSVVKFSFASSVEAERFWALLGTFEARGDPGPFLLGLLEARLVVPT